MQQQQTLLHQSQSFLAAEHHLLANFSRQGVMQQTQNLLDIVFSHADAVQLVFSNLGQEVICRLMLLTPPSNAAASYYQLARGADRVFLPSVSRGLIGQCASDGFPYVLLIFVYILGLIPRLI